MTRYLLPPTRRADTDRAHIADHGKPACGIVLEQPYTVSRWLYAYRVCEDCVKVQKSGQMGLWAEVQA